MRMIATDGSQGISHHGICHLGGSYSRGQHNCKATNMALKLESCVGTSPAMLHAQQRPFRASEVTTCLPACMRSSAARGCQGLEHQSKARNVKRSHQKLADAVCAPDRRQSDLHRWGIAAAVQREKASHNGCPFSATGHPLFPSIHHPCQKRVAQPCSG